MNPGTLRKRSRRTIVKVNGLGAVPYNEDQDSFNISSIWSFSRTKDAADAEVNEDLQKPKTVSSSNHRNSYENKRVTRNPMYHRPPLDVEANGGLDPPPAYSSKPSSAQKEEKREYHNRPHLLSDTYYNTIRFTILFGMCNLSFPWVWNRKTHRIDRSNPFLYKIWKAYWYFTTVQSICMIVYHTHRLIQFYSNDLESYRVLFAYFLILFGYKIQLGYKICFYLYEDQMRKYINQLQDFNEEYVEKYLIYADKHIEFGAAEVIIKFAIPAAGLQIPNSLFLFLTMRYPHYYLTSMINPRPWYVYIPGSIHSLSLIGQAMILYITVSWMQVVHASSIEFWLREMHKDADSPYTIDELRTPQVAIPAYRSLQLLCNDFNECMSRWCFPVWKYTVAFGFIPCAFVWTRAMNKAFIEEFPGILVYPFGTLNCFIMGFGCLTMSAQMYDIANSYICSWSRTKQKDFRKILMSFPTLNVKVGRFYFITPSTLITFIQVITNYTIDCLLTFP